MTSNVGQELISRGGSIGFSQKEKDVRQTINTQLIDEVKKTFRPEFLNRVDEIIIFNPLSKEGIRKIIQLELEPLYAKLAQQGARLEISPAALDFLAEKGFDPHYGARPLKRAIQKYLQDPLSLELLRGGLKEGSKITADLDTVRAVDKAPICVKINF